MQRSLAIEQPVYEEQGGQITWAHNTKQGGMARAAIVVEVSPGAVVAASGGGGRHAKGIWGDSAG